MLASDSLSWREYNSAPNATEDESHGVDDGVGVGGAVVSDEDLDGVALPCPSISSQVESEGGEGDVEGRVVSSRIARNESPSIGIWYPPDFSSTIGQAI